MITKKQLIRWALLGSLSGLLLFVCFKLMLAIVWSKAYNDASRQFVGEISDRDTKIASLESHIIGMSENMGRSFEESRTKIEDVKREKDHEMTKLKEKYDVKIEEQQIMTDAIIEDNERLQLEVVEANESIAYLVTLNYMSGIAWRIHEDNALFLKDVELSDTYTKIAICKEKTEYLDNKLKLRPSRELKKVAIAAAAAFVLGKLL